VAAATVHRQRTTAQEATPDLSHFPEPEALASGLTLIDQRMMLRTNGEAMFFGEIRSELDALYDSPQLLQTFLALLKGLILALAFHP
jgi:hypothetical protein